MESLGRSVPSLGEEKEGLSPWGPACECYLLLVRSAGTEVGGGHSGTEAALQANSRTVDTDRQTDRQLWVGLTWLGGECHLEDGAAQRLVSLCVTQFRLCPLCSPLKTKV